MDQSLRFLLARGIALMELDIETNPFLFLQTDGCRINW
jgi:hypothetical protein